ncbi:DUF423 domain-containing protein [Luminiphilus sp. nBUS_16]|uniref:DUF423 domain-containing protein n=1 Tax=Luminiphilus sp. nBUS_16 TaxID=3395315 RepID=UPI003EBAD9DC
MAGIGPRWPRILAALLGFLGVAAGAFGAHGLRGFVAPEQIQTWETAASYQLLHAVALLAVSGWQQRAVSPRLKFWLLWACGLIVAGVVLFSGSLYLLVLTGIGAFGPITPLGGVALLVAWLILLACGLVRESHAAP